METTASHYIPALNYRWLTPLYDPLLRWGMREDIFKRRLIARAGIRSGQVVLDLACGTGTLTLMIKRLIPGALVIGLDRDPEVLAIARRKASRAGLEIAWTLGTACDLPYPEDSFDVIVSSLAVHHLETTAKLRAFCEVRRILRPRGTFHILDFGVPINLVTRLQAAVMKHLEQAADNLEGRILPFLDAAGFASATASQPTPTLFGAIWFYEAVTA